MVGVIRVGVEGGKEENADETCCGRMMGKSDGARHLGQRWYACMRSTWSATQSIAKSKHERGMQMTRARSKISTTGGLNAWFGRDQIGTTGRCL